MLKKCVSIALAIALVLCISSPACAVQGDSAMDAAQTSTVEEVLDSYHSQLFELESQQAAGTYTCSTSAATLITQNTINELQSSGYEAYHVNPDNYTTMGAVLKTDLADLGLEEDGSYLVVISGEDGGTGNNNSNSQTAGTSDFNPNPSIYDGGKGLGFKYTYNGVTYSMRYVTVTPADNKKLFVIGDEVDLLSKMNADSAMDIANAVIAVYSALGDFCSLGTIAGLLTSIIPSQSVTYGESLKLTPSASWTIKYIQIYDDGEQRWRSYSGYEYVIPLCTLVHIFHNANINMPDSETKKYYGDKEYSEHYGDDAWVKRQAVEAYKYGVTACDSVDEVYFNCNGKRIAVLYRTMYA